VLVRRYCEAVRNLIGGVEEAVTIVASVNPLEAVVAADRVKQENSSKVKTVYYCADTLSNEKGDSGILSAEYRTKCGINWERQLFKSFDKVLIMECHKEHYFSSVFKDLSQKMELVNFPLFTRMETAPVVPTEDGITMVYAGTLYKELRNPSFLCDQLVKLSKIEPIHVIFMGSGDCDDILMNASSETKGAIQYLGMQPHEKAMEYINSAHVLLSIGNAESPMAPSKIYEYMSTGKPIIHTYTYEKDPCLEPLRRYGNALLIQVGESSPVREMSEFISKAKYLDYSLIEKMFITSTPGYSMDIIEKS
jgi:glycosyltransferase involved in cell wall biosynthesis